MKELSVILALFMLVGFAGTMSYDDEKMEAEVYRDRVCNEVWANYKNIELDCEANPSWPGVY